MAERILPMRSYERTKRMYDDHNKRGESADKLPTLPLMGDVMRNDFDLNLARKQARAQQKY